MTRAFDLIFSLVVLILTLPIWIFVPLGILISDPGPIFYKAARVGKDRRVFTMFKFRSMRVSSGGAVITAHNDGRVFKFGKLIRKLKLDELPQLINVFRGDMAIVGPRPEDPQIVDDHYSDWMLETLLQPPGLTSLGSVFYYTYGEELIDDADPHESYVANLLPPKMAVERAHMAERSLLSMIKVIMLTARAVFAKALGTQIETREIDFEAASQWASFENVPGLK